MIKTAIQFIATLAAAMLGEYLVCRLLRFPSISQPRFWIATVFWLTATLGYLIPRDLTPSLRTRILGGFLAVAALGAAHVGVDRVEAGCLIVETSASDVGVVLSGIEGVVAGRAVQVSHVAVTRSITHRIGPGLVGADDLGRPRVAEVDVGVGFVAVVGVVAIGAVEP